MVTSGKNSTDKPAGIGPTERKKPSPPDALVKNEGDIELSEDDLKRATGGAKSLPVCKAGVTE
jgi:hypothetical protein